MSEEDFDCARCHSPASLDGGCEPTRYCHHCAQALVQVYEAELTRLMDVVCDEDMEIIKSLIPQ